jgi:hypothetical protein
MTTTTTKRFHRLCFCEAAAADPNKNSSSVGIDENAPGFFEAALCQPEPELPDLARLCNALARAINGPDTGELVSGRRPLDQNALALASTIGAAATAAGSLVNDRKRAWVGRVNDGP